MLKSIIKNLFDHNLYAAQDDHILVVADFEKETLARNVYQAIIDNHYSAEFIIMETRSKSGEEPPASVVAAMEQVAICLCITEHSLTHTLARKAASAKGVKVITMPGVTEDMFTEGALKADYRQVKQLTNDVTNILDAGKNVTIKTGENGEYDLTIDIEGQNGISSTGVFEQKGDSGNLPSGESYIAPVKGKANGKILIDGSIAGIGKLSTPIILTVEDGRLTEAEGNTGEQLLAILGTGDGRFLGELGIGTNHTARVTGNILEDEKAYGTVHVAFGTNITFGGTINAGVHIDCVTLKPQLAIDGKIIVENGKVSVV